MSDAKRPVPADVALEPGVVEGDWEYQPVRLPAGRVTPVGHH